MVCRVCWVARTSGACSGRRGPSERYQSGACVPPLGPKRAEPASESRATQTRADFNAANGITIQDIFDFLAAWFAGC